MDISRLVGDVCQGLVGQEAFTPKLFHEILKGNS